MAKSFNFRDEALELVSRGAWPQMLEANVNHAPLLNSESFLIDAVQLNPPFVLGLEIRLKMLSSRQSRRIRPVRFLRMKISSRIRRNESASKPFGNPTAILRECRSRRRPSVWPQWKGIRMMR